MYIQDKKTVMEKLEILTDAAKYDVACTSSGVDRKGVAGSLGNTVASGICHCFSADGRCISLLKILFTNECIFDCKYCINRSSNDVERASFTPEEVADLTIEFYKRNYIEGLFLSSGIWKSPDHTMGKIYETLRLLREVYHFRGYIHVKTIPGADPVLIEKTGWLADRMSVNLELPTAEGLRVLAPHKNRKNILKPMRQIQLGMKANQIYLQEKDQRLRKGSNFIEEKTQESHLRTDLLRETKEVVTSTGKSLSQYRQNRIFVPAGQSTQMIIGATPESDYEIIHVAEALYQSFGLKRVFYSAFVNTTNDSMLPTLPQGPPLLREHRLYQADWLLRFYGFKASELLSQGNPNFNVLIDPKCNWALNHLEMFPIEINRADYYTLLRVPGIGVQSARRIIKARKSTILDFTSLKKIGVVLKRAMYFITCSGKMMYPVKIEQNHILRHMLDLKEKLPASIGALANYQQLSLFDTPGFSKELFLEGKM